MRKFLLGFLMSLLVIFLVACGSDDDAEKTESDEEDSEEPQTVTVEHELGTTEVDKNPEKVVVFDMGSLDTLDKLGIEVTGVPQQSVPDYLSKYEGDEYENVGGLKEPDFEKIAEIDPDLIIISGRQGDMYDELQELGDTIFLGVDTDNYMESFEDNVNTIGEIFDKETEAADALDAIEEKIDKAKETAEEADKNGLIILANDDKISAYGPSSRFGLIHDVVGVPAVDEGIEVSTHGQNVSFEYVVEQDPDLLYVIDRGAAIGEGESATKLIVENKLMEDTKAMQNDDIYYLDPEYWYLSGGGLISVEEMVNEIAESLE
ncbi:MAG TPA: siderophore ABC transporter substrate-binding protein [Pseudogracilibacillus sp.]|nr:siderophore ABC transporter substrate-binding protein [Pseudogracilibacillus sp.]